MDKTMNETKQREREKKTKSATQHTSVIMEKSEKWTDNYN